MPTLDRKAILPKRCRKPKTTLEYGGRYYNSKQWYTLRNSYIREHPLCEECLKQGNVTPATQVHHIVPFMSGIDEMTRWRLLTDVDNIMSVCDDCHHELHRKLRKLN